MGADAPTFSPPAYDPTKSPAENAAATAAYMAEYATRARAAKAAEDERVTGTGDSGDRAKAMGSQLFERGRELYGQYTGYQDRAAPRADRANIGVAPGVAIGAQGERGIAAQDALLAQLREMAAGRGPSVSAMQAKAGADAATANALGLAAASRDNIGAGLEAAQRASAAATMAAAGQAAQGRVAEQRSAIDALSGLSTTMSGQDLEREKMAADISARFGLKAADLDLARTLADLEAKLKTMGMDDQMRAAILENSMRAMGAGGEIESSVYKTSGAPKGSFEKYAMPLLSTATGAYAAHKTSDRRAKSDVERADDGDMDELLSALKAYTYRYRDPEVDGHGKRVGPMAQDLEATRLGSLLVDEDGDGKKVIDGDAMIMALASAVGRLARRVEDANG